MAYDPDWMKYNFFPQFAITDINEQNLNKVYRLISGIISI